MVVWESNRRGSGYIERRRDSLEGELVEGFTECRETSAEYFADGFNSHTAQSEVAEVA